MATLTICASPKVAGPHQLAIRQRGLPLEQLRRKLGDLDPKVVEGAIWSLCRAGVVVPKRTWVHPSPALTWLNELGVICI